MLLVLCPADGVSSSVIMSKTLNYGAVLKGVWWVLVTLVEAQSVCFKHQREFLLSLYRKHLLGLKEFLKYVAACE